MVVVLYLQDWSSGTVSDFISVIGNSQIKEGDPNISGTNVGSSYIDSISVNPYGYWEFVTCATATEIVTTWLC